MRQGTLSQDQALDIARQRHIAEVCIHRMPGHFVCFLWFLSKWWKIWCNSCSSLSLSLPHTNTNTLTLTHSLTHSLSHIYILCHSHKHTLSLSLSFILSLSHIYSLSLCIYIRYRKRKEKPGSTRKWWTTIMRFYEQSKICEDSMHPLSLPLVSPWGKTVTLQLLMHKCESDVQEDISMKMSWGHARRWWGQSHSGQL